LVLLSVHLSTSTASLPRRKKAEVAAAHPVVAAAAQRIMPMKHTAAHQSTDIEEQQQAHIKSRYAQEGLKRTVLMSLRFINRGFKRVQVETFFYSKHCNSLAVR
jgi:hypothetical protein